MNKTSKFAIGALLVGAATLASAQTQTRAQSLGQRNRGEAGEQSVDR